MQQLQRSISFRNIKWEDVDTFAHQHGFKDRSNFIEYCTSKEIHHKRLGNLKIVEIMMLLGIALTVLMLLLLYVRN